MRDFDQSAHVSRLISDREVSRGEIQSGAYKENADRSFIAYKMMIPVLEPIILSLVEQKSVVKGLDVGCGTGRAAAGIADNYPSVHMQGVTLIYHPPVGDHRFLPRHKIRIANAGNTHYPERSFDLLLAVGSLDTSDTLEYEGAAVLKLLAKGGFFIFAPAVWSKYSEEALAGVTKSAEEQGISFFRDRNDFGYPFFVFMRN